MHDMNVTTRPTKPTTHRSVASSAKDNNNHPDAACLHFRRANNHPIAAPMPVATVPRHTYNLRQTTQRTARIEKTTARIEKPTPAAIRAYVAAHTRRNQSTSSVLRQCGYTTRSDQILGSGHFSKVYRATKIGTKTINAIKVIRMDHVGTDYRTRFLPREMECWKKLKHPNLCELFDIVKYNTTYCLMIMEYCSHGDLLSYVQKNGALSDAIGRKWMGQLLDAIHYMHSNGMAHRDIKAENCLISSDQNLKLSDFGFVIEVDENAFSRTYCGSRTYSSPEILSGVPYDVFKADVWSLGCLVYVSMTGTMPFREDGQSSIGIVEQQRRRNLRYPNFVAQDVITAVESMLIFAQEARPSAQMAKRLGFFAYSGIMTFSTEFHVPPQSVPLMSHIQQVFTKVPMTCK